MSNVFVSVGYSAACEDTQRTHSESLCLITEIMLTSFDGSKGLSPFWASCNSKAKTKRTHRVLFTTFSHFETRKWVKSSQRLDLYEAPRTSLLPTDWRIRSESLSNSLPECHLNEARSLTEQRSKQYTI
jgi:hypothetical protein